MNYECLFLSIGKVLGIVVVFLIGIILASIGCAWLEQHVSITVPRWVKKTLWWIFGIAGAIAIIGFLGLIVIAEYNTNCGNH